MNNPALRRFALCIPDLDLSFYWMEFLHHARSTIPARGWALCELAVASTAAQASALGRLTLSGGDVLALRPLTRHQAELLAPLARLRAGGAVILLLGELDGWDTPPLCSDHAGAMSLALHAAGRVQQPRSVRVLGSAPHASVSAAALAGLPSAAQARALAPCLSSLPDDLRGHGRTELLRSHQEAPLQAGDVVVAVDDQLALGAADAAERIGLAGLLYIAGAGASPAALLAIEAGRLQASTYIDPLAWLARLLDWAEHPGQAPGAPVPAALVDRAGLAAFCARQQAAYLHLLDQSVRQLRETRQAAEFMESVVESMPAMLFVKRMPDLRFHLINKAREDWLGMPREQIIGRTAYDFNSREVADLYTERDREVLEKGAIVDQPVMPVQLANGEQRYVLTRKIPLFGANGQPNYLVGISIDVTARQLAEQDLARRTRELEVAHAALKDNQHKLLVAEKMAALGRLTAGIAHEMNTPLAAIRAAMSELRALADEMAASIGDASVTESDFHEMAAEIRHSAALADKSAERAASFVRSVKHHTRNHGRDEKVAFDAVQVSQESLLLLDHQIKRHRCTVTPDHPPGRLELLGAPGGFSQVITNLVSNALDACGQDGGGLVRLVLASDGAMAQLSVSDNGSGIAPDNLLRIFDPMFTTKAFGHGTGLGLAIVHEIVHDQFGGRIDVASTPGAGTTFQLHFPLACVPGAPPEQGHGT